MKHVEISDSEINITGYNIISYFYLLLLYICSKDTDISNFMAVFVGNYDYRASTARV